MRLPFFIAIPFIAIAGTSAALSQEQEKKPDATVRMDDYAFQPETVTIQAGQTILWMNTSPVIHTVTADPRRANDPKHVALPEGAEPFNSGEIYPGEKYQRTFTVPGTYRYFCMPHESLGMLGTIKVQSARQTPDASSHP